jgi:hypothetical protein
MATNIETQILSFVRSYIEQNERGCPKGVLLHVGGFKQKDILAMLDAGTLESGRGSEGGIFPRGEKPMPKGDAPTLKGEAFGILRTLANGGHVSTESIARLVEQYDAECAARRKS